MAGGKLCTWRGCGCPVAEARQGQAGDLGRGKPELWGTGTTALGSLSHVRRRLRSEFGFGAKSQERGSHHLLGEERPPPESALGHPGCVPGSLLPDELTGRENEGQRGCRPVRTPAWSGARRPPDQYPLRLLFPALLGYRGLSLPTEASAHNSECPAPLGHSATGSCLCL